MRISFYVMFGNTSVYTSTKIEYLRITEGKIVFQRSNDYKICSYSLTRVHDVEVRYEKKY